ncbi:MAG: hypothetical protein MJ188_00745 [Treponema sp.]|nr:hypothetical protein [Treponema sp.]
MAKNKDTNLLSSSLKNYIKAFCVVFVIFVIIFAVAFSTSDLKDVEKLKSLNGYFKELLSGAIVGLVSVILVYVSLQDCNKSKKMENQLQLREMFATDKRIWIHEQLYIHPEKDKRTLREEYEGKFQTKNKDYDNESEFDLALYDYMGLFGVCSYLIKDGQLDRDAFFDSYSYRLHCLTKSKAVEEEFSGSPEYWWKLKELIKDNKGWRTKHGLPNF